jgi:hypothetical protein
MGVKMNQVDLQRLLEFYPYIQGEINKKQDELLEEVRNKDDILDTLKAALITGMPHGYDVSNPVLNVVGKAMDVYCNRIAVIIAEIDDLFNKKQLVEDLLKKCSPSELTIIKLRLFEGKSWNCIARSTNYSIMQCWRKIENGIKKML